MEEGVEKGRWDRDARWSWRWRWLTLPALSSAWSDPVAPHQAALPSGARFRLCCVPRIRLVPRGTSRGRRAWGDLTDLVEPAVDLHGREQREPLGQLELRVDLAGGTECVGDVLEVCGGGSLAVSFADVVRNRRHSAQQLVLEPRRCAGGDVTRSLVEHQREGARTLPHEQSAMIGHATQCTGHPRKALPIHCGWAMRTQMAWERRDARWRLLDGRGRFEIEWEMG